MSDGENFAHEDAESQPTLEEPRRIAIKGRASLSQRRKGSTRRLL
jgi:hypothetical protein